MGKVREGFENTFPEKSIFEYVDYDSEFNMYGSKEHVSGQELIGLFAAIANLNGAWWAWQSRQAEVDLLQQYNDDLAGGQCCLYRELKEKDKRIVSQNDFIEIALITLNHLKENAVTHRDYGHECNWTRSFNDLIKLASDAEDSLKEALRGEHE